VHVSLDFSHDDWNIFGFMCYGYYDFLLSADKSNSTNFRKTRTHSEKYSSMKILLYKLFAKEEGTTYAQISGAF
jgi:hypothetical protein